MKRIMTLGAWLVWLGVACGGISQRQPGEGAAGSTGEQQIDSGAGGKHTSPSGATSGSGGMVELCDAPCLRALIDPATGCRLCHDGRTLAASGLDLESPGLAARLKDVPAKHADLSPGMSATACSMGDKLIDSADPQNSWLLKKIRGQQGQCGNVEPPIGMLQPSEIACFEMYVTCVAGQ
jgi:hypothetical protein